MPALRRAAIRPHTGRAVFHFVPPPTPQQLAALARRLFERVVRILRRRGLSRGRFERINDKGCSQQRHHQACDVWDRLAAIPNALQEPLGTWLPDNLRPPGTSEYVQGVEVAVDYDGDVPEGFEIAELPACKMMVFQGPPFEEKDFEQAIQSLWDVMKSYKPETYGFAWTDCEGPRFQLKPEGYRGHIEVRPVRQL